MGLGGVPASERVHIGFFGKRNAGKSSLINAVTGQNLSIVSDTLGTRPIRFPKPWSFFLLDLW